jgi:hypothetical protein
MPKIEKDAFGWLLIKQAGRTLQAFRSESECRAWLADTARIRRAMFGAA